MNAKITARVLASCLGTIAAPALAQSSSGASSSVTLYGILDAGIEYTNEDANATVSSNAGRLGDSGLHSYALSKRTNLYAATGLASDVIVGSGAGAPNTDPVALALGIRHLF